MSGLLKLTSDVTLNWAPWEYADAEGPCWTEPDWTAIGAALTRHPGVRAVTFTPRGEADSGARRYDVSVLAHGPSFTGSSVWGTMQSLLRLADEPLTDVGVMECVMEENGGLPDELLNLLTPAFRAVHDAAYTLTPGLTHLIEDAA